MTAEFVPATQPILPGFHPDPSICRVGDTYWMACSSFEYAPGVPLFRSTNLTDWDQVGNVLARPSQLDVATAAPSGGVYAPTLRHHDGRFWMITTNWSDDQGQILTWAEDPAGDWSDPVRLPEVKGIDPDLAWDGDGTCFLTYSGWVEGGTSRIVQQVIDPSTGVILSGPVPLWSGTGGKWPEAPHLYRIGDLWYLLIAEGGTERGHAVTIARGPSASGPFAPCPANPLLTARGTNRPVQSTGHADLVRRPDGSWAIVYHGTRPRGVTPEWHVLGRETFASNVEWTDGWPELTTPVEPVTAPAVTIDELGDTLPPHWAGAHRFAGELLRRTGKGWVLTGPGFAGRRQQHHDVRVTATLDARHGTGGLEIRLDPRHRLTVEINGSEVRAVAQIGDLISTLGRADVADPGDVHVELRATAVTTFTGPDQLVAVVAGVELARMDGRYLSTEVAGGFTGRMIGLRADRGELGVTSFVYHGSTSGDGAL
ncbi:family 43 glycosylhydrolase [Actinoplanes sp. NPDC020271]|uniref:glycoside hydrolase family 43 protein n=1 Tax=Actinoplanes sp. NPDC020271 TaxID=3363896 RepID=UPI0037919B82